MFLEKLEIRQISKYFRMGSNSSLVLTSGLKDSIVAFS